MRTEAEVRAARDKLWAAAAELNVVVGAAFPLLMNGPNSALAALSWALGDDAEADEKFGGCMNLTDDFLREVREKCRAAAERN